MSPETLKEILRERVSEFGEKPSYVLFPDELQIGRAYGLFDTDTTEDKGDGTTITTVTFVGNMFLCATQKD